MKIVNSSDFYWTLAHLFYAIATIDKRIEIEEKLTIKKLVEDNWTIKTDHSTSQEIIFETLKKLFKEKPEAEDAFGFFSNFFHEHHDLFSEELKKVILDDANKIAQSFSGTNKSESILISRLFFLMNEKK